MQNKIQSTLNFLVESDVLVNKNLLFTDISENNLNPMANGQDESLANLRNAYKIIKPLDALVNKYKLNKTAYLIYPQVYERVHQQMDNYMDKLTSVGLYSSGNNFISWNGETSPAQSYFSVSSEVELSDYINRQKLFISKFYADYTEALFQVHSTLNATYKDTLTSKASKFWQKIKSEIIDKNEKGSITQLNEFILNTMDKANTNSCYSLLKTVSAFRRYELDYFDGIKYDLARKLALRCEKIFYDKSVYEYNLLARDF